MKQLKFQKTWEAHAMGALWGEMVAKNFSLKNPYRNIAGLKEKNVLFYFDKDLGTQFYNRLDELKNSSIFGYKKFSDKKNFSRYLNLSKKSIVNCDKLYINFLNSDWQKWDDVKLWKEFKKHVYAFNYIYTFYHACQPQYFEKIEDTINKYLEKNFEQNKILKIYNILTTPDNFNCIRIEEFEWLSIVKSIKNLKSYKLSKEDFLNKKKIKNHINKYIALGTVEANTPWDYKFYWKRFNKDFKKNLNKKIQKIKNTKKIAFQNKLKILKKYNIDKKIIDLSNKVSAIGILRLDMRFGWTKLGYTTQLMFTELGKRKIHELINENTIWDIKFDELDKLILKKNFKLTKREILNRKNAFLYNVQNGKINFYEGIAAKKIKNKLILNENYNLKEFKGSIACVGRVIGRVIKFSWTEPNLIKKMERMKKGDILVAGQTRPTLMTAIHKAGAIVTDEGGIISHAAIISRELKKPCIIGTKIATKILKDGDLVEVDANNGIVKILKD